jgi:chromosome segregation ATPase
LGLNKNLQNESDFIATQDSILLSQIETELRSSIIKKSELESSINELNSILPKLSEEESLLENKLLDTNLELLNLESINHSLLKEIDQVKEDINAHELSIPKLLTTYNNVLKEFNEISKRRGINYLEKLEEIVKSKPELICIVCSSSEGGRMKKCLVCSAPVHAKCTRDLKFVCEICKSK